jgi:putative oxidoreductase
MFGFLTPLGAAGIIGVMVGTLPVHAPKGLWNTNGGFELPLTFATAAAALAYAGPGNYSVDHVIGWLVSGGAMGTAAVAFGALAGAVMVSIRAGRVQVQEQREAPRRAA